LPPFQRDWWQCMPDPLSPNRGFGMNVAVLPWLRAVFFTTYLNICKLSAVPSSVE